MLAVHGRHSGLRRRGPGRDQKLLVWAKVSGSLPSVGVEAISGSQKRRENVERMKLERDRAGGVAGEGGSNL